jgi:hypothetical protein
MDRFRCLKNQRIDQVAAEQTAVAVHAQAAALPLKIDKSASRTISPLHRSQVTVHLLVDGK